MRPHAFARSMTTHTLGRSDWIRPIFQTLLRRGDRTIGNLHSRGAARWGWMKGHATGESDAALQRLVDFCSSKIEYDHDRLDPAAEAELMRLLESVPIQALGFHEDVISQPDERYMGSTSVSYMHVAEKEGCFSMGVFLFKDGAALPLHDHPRMSVYSRALFGTIDVRSFDWVEAPAPRGGAAQARLAAVCRLQPSMVSALHPDAGNVHSFQAHTPAAIFDILVPGYCGGRSCSYFEATSTPADDDSSGGRTVHMLHDAPAIAPSVLSTAYPGSRPIVT
eukprot:jgi/Ulvmu1/10356/UM061_0039.1